ncbi:MAG: tRNA-binding protein [Nitriliruptoraceae bacterium]
MAEVSHRLDPQGRPYEPSGLEPKPEIGIEGFEALDLRIGTVRAAEPFPEARAPSLKLTVDFGPVIGTKRTSARIANYTPEELVGRQVVGALNLGARRIAGFRSEFLVLGGLAADGTVHLLAPDGQLDDGAPVA